MDCDYCSVKSTSPQTCQHSIQSPSYGDLKKLFKKKILIGNADNEVMIIHAFGGEPTLNKVALDYLEKKRRSNNIYPIISTNGIKQDRIMELSRNKWIVIISHDGPWHNIKAVDKSIKALKKTKHPFW